MAKSPLIVFFILLAACSPAGSGDSPADIAPPERQAISSPASPTTTVAEPSTSTIQAPKTTTPPTTVAAGSETPAFEEVPPEPVLVAPAAAKPVDILEVTITGPAEGSVHDAAFDAAEGDTGAWITFTATANDPHGNEKKIDITWTADTQGLLGTVDVDAHGDADPLTAFVSSQGQDTLLVTVTATATNDNGEMGEAVVSFIVSIPSS